jgi:DNA-binding response OmpR family regulator
MKILICDDDQAIAQLIRFKLEKENVAELFIAANGHNAMELLKEHNFDLLITDLHMPYYNGDAIMETLREKSLTPVPVIMMSSDAQEEVQVLAKKQGVLHFMPKPFKVPDLVKIVKRIFERKVIQLGLSPLSVSHRR